MAADKLKEQAGINTPLSALVVEDDFASRQYLLLLLKKLNVSALAAETGETALELMQGKEWISCYLILPWVRGFLAWS